MTEKQFNEVLGIFHNAFKGLQQSQPELLHTMPWYCNGSKRAQDEKTLEKKAA